MFCHQLFRDACLLLADVLRVSHTGKRPGVKLPLPLNDLGQKKGVEFFSFGAQIDRVAAPGERDERLTSQGVLERSQLTFGSVSRTRQPFHREDERLGFLQEALETTLPGNSCLISLHQLNNQFVLSLNREGRLVPRERNVPLEKTSIICLLVWFANGKTTSRPSGPELQLH
ncbi:hypothetical protein KIL84_020757 [Mauremys mutica]|uniref:Uncharacterized protein n=1 Tax=Mauremys mutica TaxID=74926 RepID=A0A9D4AZB2_9SAUR|nr:hypothetical protein KIL84_020757 [Mauremys mutica]